MNDWYSTKEIANICGISVQKTSAILTQLYYEGKVEREERRIKKSGFNFIHIRIYVYRSIELENIDELVKRKK